MVELKVSFQHINYRQIKVIQTLELESTNYYSNGKVIFYNFHIFQIIYF